MLLAFPDANTISTSTYSSRFSFANIVAVQNAEKFFVLLPEFPWRAIPLDTFLQEQGSALPHRARQAVFEAIEKLKNSGSGSHSQAVDHEMSD